jgi:hypothetical protein
MNLVADLKLAIEAANAVENRDDGGSCNFDSIALKPPSPSKKKFFEAAIQEAGLNAWYADERPWKGNFMVSPPNGGQAAYRTRQVEAMKKVLKEKGYEVTIYYQAD